MTVETEQTTSAASSAPAPASLGALVADLLDAEAAAAETPRDDGEAPEEWRKRKSELEAVLRSLDA
jgi:hypothetical protein